MSGKVSEKMHKNKRNNNNDYKSERSNKRKKVKRGNERWSQQD